MPERGGRASIGEKETPLLSRIEGGERKVKRFFHPKGEENLLLLWSSGERLRERKRLSSLAARRKKELMPEKKRHARQLSQANARGREI